MGPTAKRGTNLAQRISMAVTVIALLIGTAGVALASDTVDGRRDGGPTRFGAILSGGAEVPPVDTGARGRASLAAGHDVVRFGLFLDEIEGVTQAHIHVGAAGTNGDVVAFLFGPADPPTGPISGELIRGTLRTEDLLGPLAGDMSGFLAALDAGELYVNVHTVDYPSGHLRGQLFLRSPVTDSTTTTITDDTTTTTDATTTTTDATTTTTDATTTTTDATTTTTDATTTTTDATTTTTDATTTTTDATTTTTTLPPPGETDVDIFEFGFGPDPVTVSVGDTITWTNTGQVVHTTTAGTPGNETGVWDSGTLNPGDTFTRTFSDAGTFQYFCTIHPTTMQSSVIVEG